MNRITIGVLAALAALPGHAQSPGIGRLRWLRGCWQASSPSRVIEEHWMPPRGRSMLNVGRTLRGDSLVEYELVVVREQGGGFTYEAHPSGQAPATFTSHEATDSAVVFENVAHDFPQRVGYRKAGADSLVAWIEGPRNGQTRRIEFRYARQRCDEP